MMFIETVLGLNLVLGIHLLVIVNLHDALGNVRDFKKLFIGGTELIQTHLGKRN